jgi:hypothetical protein
MKHADWIPTPFICLSATICPWPMEKRRIKVPLSGKSRERCLPPMMLKTRYSEYIWSYSSAQESCLWKNVLLKYLVHYMVCLGLSKKL